MNEIRTVMMLFYGDRGRYFEVIDEDGYRKPVITTAKRKDDGDTEFWEVTVNRSLLKKWLGGEK